MPDRLDAATLRRAMGMFAESLRAHREELNSLNVYPVPDGDTGTNLLMTQEAVVSALSSPADGDDIKAVGAAVARASLMGARGNSGVILSQILRGLCEEPPHEGALDPKELAAALGRAAEEAFRAVARPVEGTILTVMRDAARAAADVSGPSDRDGCLAVVEAALEEARASLARTRDLLPELRRSGVVDAGGRGVVLLLDALRAALADTTPSEQVGPLGPVGEMVGTGDVPTLEFSLEVQYLLEGSDEAIPSLRRALDSIGDSVVVVGGNGLFNVHVHTNDSARAIQLGAEAGEPRDVRVVDLQGEVVDCIGGQARAVRVAEQAAAGLVAVVEGDGLAEAFASLGAVVVKGGPGNSPRVETLAQGIETAPAASVIVLPNDPTVIPAAERAAGRSTKDVLVLPTPSVPSGLAAATAFNPLAAPEELMPDLQDAADACGWGELAPAEADAPTRSGEGGRKGWLGSARGTLVAECAEPHECAVEVVGRLAAHDSEVITLIEGGTASPGDRQAVRAALQRAFPEMRLEALDGGQPRPPFLIGVE